jgi:hypothetical protein
MEEQRTLAPRRKRDSNVDHLTREQRRFIGVNRVAQGAVIERGTQ